MKPPAIFTLREVTPHCHGGALQTMPVVGPAVLSFPMEHIRINVVEAVMVMLYVEHEINGERCVSYTADMMAMN